jgi:hypothetical protein
LPLASAWSLVASQVPERSPRLFAWVSRRKIAKPEWLQHRYKSRPESGRPPSRASPFHLVFYC